MKKFKQLGELRSSPKSARNHRIGWAEERPPEKYRVYLLDAVKAAGGVVQLAGLMGITRSAIYQLRPPYRHDPYLPVESARRLLKEHPWIKKELELYGSSTKQE